MTPTSEETSRKMRVVNQALLTGECLMIQLFGQECCETCDAKRSGCGGRDIRNTGRNRKGIKVPVGERDT